MVNRLMFWTCCVLAATAPVASAWGIETPSLRWTMNIQADYGGGNPYYLNGNVDGAGALTPHISYGVHWIDLDGNVLETLSTTSAAMFNGHGGKAMVRIGDYYYLSHDDAGGIARIDATGGLAWDAASWDGTVDPSNTLGAVGPEAICSDGTRLFTNNDIYRGAIHSWSINNTLTPFALTEEWMTYLPAGGRVRGLSYDAASGYIYLHNGGDGASTSLYAVDGDSGAAHDMGTHVEGGIVYQALRCNDQLLVAGTSDVLTVYDLASDTQINPTPVGAYNLGVGDIYGLSRIGGTLFVASTGKMSAFTIYKAGDANYDGAVNDTDASILGANWQMAGGGTWETGDFNADGAVNDADAAIMASNWTAGGGDGSVPEPSTLVMLFGAAVMAWLVRRSR